MWFRSAISKSANVDTAVGELVHALASGAPPDLAALFFSASYVSKAETLARRLQEALSPGLLIGCSAEGVIGATEEIEGDDGIALLLADLPGAELVPFHIGVGAWQDLLSDSASLAGRCSGSSPAKARLLFGDPFTTPADDLLVAFDALSPGVPTVGGMASAGRRPGENALILGDQVMAEGAVGLAIGGNVEVDAVVSQGCRPVGERLLVTSAEGNAIRKLGGRDALEAADRMLRTLSAEERDLLSNGLFLGVAVNEYQAEFRRGDFLVRNLVGVAPESGALMVANEVRAGQTVQFHIRDAYTATEDLRLLLSRHADSCPGPSGALLFSCNGRGTRLFDRLSHDIGAIHQSFPALPVGGFFAAGEIGPIGGKSFIHGHTASIAFLRPGDEAAQSSALQGADDA